MSRYEDISTEVTDMKDLIKAINIRFDQTHKKIDAVDGKIDKLEVMMGLVLDNLGIKNPYKTKR